jgi:hypothetical protein
MLSISSGTILQVGVNYQEKTAVICGNCFVPKNLHSDFILNRYSRCVFGCMNGLRLSRNELQAWLKVICDISSASSHSGSGASIGKG